MIKQQIIIKLRDEWMQMNITPYDELIPITSPGPIGIPPKMPFLLTCNCDIIYNATTKIMVKNRYGDEFLQDAVIMRMWLENGLPIFTWEGRKAFEKLLQNLDTV